MFQKILKNGGNYAIGVNVSKMFMKYSKLFLKKTADHECFIERLQFVSGTVTGAAAQQHTVQQHSHRCSSTLTLSRAAGPTLD